MRYSPVALLFLILFSTSMRLTGQDTLLLFHPTVDNLHVILQLSKNNVLDLNGIHVLGVYHGKEKYEYRLSREFLAGQPDLPFSLTACESELSPDHLYKKNGCSDTFFRLFQHSVGALFMGGPDLPPEIYQEPVHLLTVVTDPFRHFFEASYLFHLLGGDQNSAWTPFMDKNAKYLISGICLGMQTMNVSTGGTLIQDIPTELYGNWLADQVLASPSDQQHRNYADKLNVGCAHPTSYHFHPIRLKDNTFITSNSGIDPGLNPLVLSSHHQAVEKLGQGWQVAATSMDGKVVEAIGHVKYPHVFGVQFHPEKAGLFDPSVRHPTDCNNDINFMETIAGTPSYGFHLTYWKYVSEILQEISNR
jgi:putative glutamine amidotransferase